MNSKIVFVLALVVAAFVLFVVFLVFFSCIGCGTGNPFGQDAKSVIKSLVKDVSNRGVGLAKQENVLFNIVPILRDEIIQNLRFVSLTFLCADQDFCGDGDPMLVSSDIIEVNKKTTGSIVVCSGDGLEYVAVIGNRGKTELEQAMIVAKKECGLF